MAAVLYDFTAAPSPRRARILLAEKGIDHETVQVDLMKAEQLGDAYRQINPACTVPALKLDDGTILTENIGIAAWAEAVKPEPPLFGTTPEEKGLVFSWNARIEFDGFMPIAEVLRNTSKGMVNRALPGPVDLPQIPELAARGALRLARFFDMLNERLKGREFIAIDRYSFADITALVCVDFAKWVKQEPRPDHADLLRWHAAVSARPSAKA
ncbi:glutathione S-transferase [uncultured Parvibaculum sp.]|uniref:glutathione S-transferase family protein n=1 Tax=uncultured Parvibaculum sp. TaxID=291828 RepID=UPI0030D74E4F|tara:strand:- start:43019 stop:43654 length:636 start_codon:yes stop_codon:yes gene_type:complete